LFSQKGKEGEDRRKFFPSSGRWAKIPSGKALPMESKQAFFHFKGRNVILRKGNFHSNGASWEGEGRRRDEGNFL